MLQRDLRFGRRGSVEIARGAVRAGVSIGMAVSGFGVWALVGGLLAGELAGTTLSWALVGFRPRLTLDAAIVRAIMGFGLAFIALKISDAIALDSDYLIVGHALGPTQLGYYTIAYRLPELALMSLYWIFGTVAFPLYSQARARDMDVLGLRAAARAAPDHDVQLPRRGAARAALARRDLRALRREVGAGDHADGADLADDRVDVDRVLLGRPLPGDGAPGTLLVINTPLTVLLVVVVHHRRALWHRRDRGQHLVMSFIAAGARLHARERDLRDEARASASRDVAGHLRDARRARRWPVRCGCSMPHGALSLVLLCVRASRARSARSIGARDAVTECAASSANCARARARERAAAVLRGAARGAVARLADEGADGHRRAAPRRRRARARDAQPRRRRTRALSFEVADVLSPPGRAALGDGAGARGGGRTDALPLDPPSRRSTRAAAPGARDPRLAGATSCTPTSSTPRRSCLPPRASPAVLRYARFTTSPCRWSRREAAQGAARGRVREPQRQRGLRLARIARELRAGYGGPRANWSVIENGVDLDLFTPERRRRRRSSACPEGAPRGDDRRGAALTQGSRVALAAWPRCSADPAGAHLLIVGERAEEAQTLREQAQALGIEDSVIFAGMRTDVATLIRASTLLALPSEHEALPTTLIEAAACGRAVVATRRRRRAGGGRRRRDGAARAVRRSRCSRGRASWRCCRTSPDVARWGRALAVLAEERFDAALWAERLAEVYARVRDRRAKSASAAAA